MHLTRITHLLLHLSESCTTATERSWWHVHPIHLINNTSGHWAGMRLYASKFAISEDRSSLCMRPPQAAPHPCKLVCFWSVQACLQRCCTFDRAFTCHDQTTVGKPQILLHSPGRALVLPVQQIMQQSIAVHLLRLANLRYYARRYKHVLHQHSAAVPQLVVPPLNPMPLSSWQPSCCLLPHALCRS